jgi:hypothetical protein
MAAAKKKTVKKKLAKKKTATTRKILKKVLKKISASEKKEMITHITDATQKQLQKIGDKVSATKEKDIGILKDLAKKIRLFANDATELTKIKITIHNLKHEHDSMLKVMGENLFNMHKSKKVKNVDTKFKYDFNKLEAIEKEIADKEKIVDELSHELSSIE